MGTVYEALGISTHLSVAIKVLHAKYCQVADVVNRFNREARLAASFGHENICEVIDFGTLENGAPYLVMPMLKGNPLSEMLKDNRASLSEGRVSNIISQTLSALATAHDAGIVHRDLKPDNIFVTSNDNGEDFVKLLDFGVSKLVASQSGSVYTKEGTVIGTPAYMAPEQAKGLKTVDHRIDIYAMGVILYEIMTGQRPYSGASFNETIFKIIGEPFLSPRRLNSNISPTMEQVIIKAMAKDPVARFKSALDMSKAFEQAVGTASLPLSRETSAPTAVSQNSIPFDLSERVPPHQRPHQRPHQTLIIVAVCLLVLTLIYVFSRWTL